MTFRDGSLTVLPSLSDKVRRYSCPMDNTWIKLYRKAKENDIIKDATAWQLFSWILMSVDRKTGKYTTGRFLLSEALGIKPSTVQKVLKRLEKKYNLVSLSSNNKFTEISVRNWEKYQSPEEAVSQESINKVSTKYQQSITKQEVKNTRKRESVSEEKNHEHLSYLISLSAEDITHFRDETSATSEQILNKAQELHSYCQYKGKRYKNYKQFLLNALRKDYPKKQSLAEESGFMPYKESVRRGLAW